MESLAPSEWQGLYQLSEAGPLGLPFETFREALQAVAEKHLPGTATRLDQKAFYRKLHLRDWTLAQACSFGSAAAWELFLQRFRSGLYKAAIRLVRDAERAHELADSVAGDLFVSQHAARPPGSNLASYSGRGSLEGWLNALLTNSYLDEYRIARRVISLEERVDVLKRLCVRPNTVTEEIDPRLNNAIQQSFSQCHPRERFLLTAYFFERWTLQELATVLGVHESSVSRRVNRVIRELRRRIHHHLQRTGMSAYEMKELFRQDFDISMDLRGLLVRGWARE